MANPKTKYLCPCALCQVRRHPQVRRFKVYVEPRDWWIGYYRGDTHHYVCPLPTLVIRWARSVEDGEA